MLSKLCGPCIKIAPQKQFPVYVLFHLDKTILLIESKIDLHLKLILINLNHQI